MSEIRNGGAVGPVRQVEGGARPGSPSIELELPMPPSVNEIWRKSKTHMYLSRTYTDWKSHAGWMLKSQRPGSIKGRVLILVSIEGVDNRSDIDNRVKAIFDLLAAYKVIQNDKLVVGFCACWTPPGTKLARVLVMPAASHDFTFLLAADGAHGGFFLKDDNQDANFSEQFDEDVG